MGLVLLHVPPCQLTTRRSLADLRSLSLAFTAVPTMLYSSKGLAAFVSAVGIASNAALAISVPFVKNSKATSGDDDFQFQNNEDFLYIATIKVLGQDFQVRQIFHSDVLLMFEMELAFRSRLTLVALTSGLIRQA